MMVMWWQGWRAGVARRTVERRAIDDRREAELIEARDALRDAVLQLVEVAQSFAPDAGDPVRVAGSTVVDLAAERGRRGG